VNIEELAVLDDKAIWRLIFPPAIPYKAKLEHQAWRPWVRPSDSTLDVFIADLVADDKTRRRARSVGLKTRSELASGPRRIVCPYYHARLSIFYAVRQARRWVEFVNTNHAYLPSRRAKLDRTIQLADAITLYLKNGIEPSTTRSFLDYAGRADPNDQRKRAQAHRQLLESLNGARSALGNHAQQIEQDLDRGSVHGNSRHSAWKGTFAAELCYCWTDLTGERPTLSLTKDNRDFQTFVGKAFQSIGGDPKEKWARTIRGVLHDQGPSHKKRWPRKKA
jgi:hypothetical protein